LRIKINNWNFYNKNKNHMNTNQKSLIVIFLIITIPLQAQIPTGLTQEYLQLTPTIPTPNVASFTKYGEIPVSEYTGVPDITIPVYTLKDGPVNMPITLRYNASGIKVEEQSDWIGLGWNLNVGGQITHIIIGQDDELCYDDSTRYFYLSALKTMKQPPYQPYIPFVDLQPFMITGDGVEKIPLNFLQIWHSHI
jgi:hypothetical protein